MPEAYVYILRCADGSLYTGWTVDLDRRLAAHAAGTGSRYTRARLPVTLAASWAMAGPDGRAPRGGAHQGADPGGEAQPARSRAAYDAPRVITTTVAMPLAGTASFVLSTPSERRPARREARGRRRRA